MFVIGVTGGIGSGKSSVAAIIEKRGALRIDADVLSHEATNPGAAALGDIVSAFGDVVLRADGSMDREMVSRIVFADAEKKRALENIVHHHVVVAIDTQLAALRETDQLVVLDVPIPIERGFLDVCDVVIAVVCADDIRIKRVMKRSSLSEEAVRMRIRSQRSQEAYRALATYTIDNSGTEAELHLQVEMILSHIPTV